MTFSLPDDKMTTLQTLISDALTRHTFTKRQLQVIAGKLCFATKVYHGGLCFLRRILDIINKLKKPWSRYHISANLRLDLEWWREILPRLDGNAPIIDTRGAESVIIGASYEGLHACRLDDHVFVPRAALSPDVNQLSPTYRHVLAVITAARQWYTSWCNKRIYIHCACIGAVAIINKGSCSNTLVMKFMRELWALSVLYNFRITARVYLPADHLLLSCYVATQGERTRTGQTV